MQRPPAAGVTTTAPAPGLASGAALAQVLREAVLAQHFELTPDRLRGGAPVEPFPSLDLAVIGFPAAGAPLVANVLFSRDAPQGWIGNVGTRGERARNVHWLADQTDAAGVSVAWQPGADWARLHWASLAAPPAEDPAALRFVAPYPASLLKVLVAVGLAMAMDRGLLAPAGVEAAARAMIVDSDNDATTRMVRLLHELGLVRRERGTETFNALHDHLHARDLATLRLADTAADGGWGNAAGSGVGHIQMTAWDTARLLWLLDPHAPAPTWPQASRILTDASRDRVLAWMGEPSPNRILLRDEAAAGVHFTHKTGTTENYGSDAGIVRGRGPNRRHYIVALLSNLGSRYGPPGAEFDVSPKLSGLGQAIDAIMRDHLEPTR